MATASSLTAGLSAREASHVAYFGLLVAGDSEGALTALPAHLDAWPRDVMVLATTAFTNGLIGSSGRAGQKRMLLDLLAQPLDDSIYELLRDRYGVECAKAVERMVAVLADDDQSSLLGIKVGDPLMAIERVSYDVDGKPIEYSTDLFRGDRTRVIAYAYGAGRDGAGRAEAGG